MINLMNYYEHPGDNRYYIFEYRHVEKAMNFESLLEEYSVNFEKLVEEETEKKVWMVLYAISKDDFKLALRANNLTEAKYRSPLIGNAYLRYFFVFLMISLMVLVFYGYMKSK